MKLFKMENNEFFIMLAIIYGIIVLLITPYFTDDTWECIADKTTFFAMTTCTYCQDQKALIGEENLKFFDIVYCDKEGKEECEYHNITLAPTWKVGNNYYRGFKELNELKNYTGC